MPIRTGTPRSASTSVVSVGAYSRFRIGRALPRRTGACIRYRKFEKKWRVSDPANPSRKLTSSFGCASIELLTRHIARLANYWCGTGAAPGRRP